MSADASTRQKLEIGVLLRAVEFAAEKHRDQRRKGPSASPYINHPIEVAAMLASVAGVQDVEVLLAALLHDTIEDTATTPAELEAEFGLGVRDLVMEVTDDKSLPKAERKLLQIEHAPHLSAPAKLLKIADKTANLREVTDNPPTDWSQARRLDYLDWAEQVVAGCRGVNATMEERFDETLKRARRTLSQ